MGHGIKGDKREHERGQLGHLDIGKDLDLFLSNLHERLIYSKHILFFRFFKNRNGFTLISRNK